MNRSDQLNVAWIIKHRPTCVKDVVGSEAKLVQKFIDSGTIPHFLFYSRTPGTGKTSLSKAMIKDLDADYIELNSSMDRGIEIVREKIKQFISTMSSKPGVKKIVFMDEFDGNTKIAQQALKSMMEDFGKNAMFILTCNNIEKIIEPIQNRCEVITFGTADKGSIYEYCENICVLENVKFTEEGLKKLIDIHYPSIRNVVGDLQKFKAIDVEVTEAFVKKSDEKFELLWTNLKNKKVLDVRREILEQGYDEDLLLRFFFLQTYEDKTLSNIQIVKLSKVLADINYKFSVGADKRIQIGAGVFDIFQAVM